MTKVYQAIAARFDAMSRANEEWIKRHNDRIESIVKEYMPYGSGFDCGTAFDDDNSKPERLIFTTQFHHMNDCGMYDGWTEHKVIVTPSFFGPNIQVTGVNRNGVKDYIADIFNDALSSDCDIQA